MSIEGSILNKITENVINDYYTAGIKTEVVIDTLITPVITNLIKEMLKGSDVIEGELEYITKEFPMIKKEVDFSKDGKWYYSNNKADYLLKDDENIYLVELKTSIDSINVDQIAFYDNYIQRINRNTLLAEFMALFNSVSNTGMGDKKYREKMRAYLNDNNDSHEDISLKKLLSNTFGEDKINKKNAIGRLKENCDSSSKKYLIQATEIAKAIPDDMEDKSYIKIRKVKLIYIVPDKEAFLEDYENKISSDMIVCGLKDLQYDNKCHRQICDDKTCRYYSWLKDQILKPIFNKP